MSDMRIEQATQKGLAMRVQQQKLILAMVAAVP